MDEKIVKKFLKKEFPHRKIETKMLVSRMIRPSFEKEIRFIDIWVDGKRFNFVWDFVPFAKKHFLNNIKNAIMKKL